MTNNFFLNALLTPPNSYNIFQPTCHYLFADSYHAVAFAAVAKEFVNFLKKFQNL